MSGGDGDVGGKYHQPYFVDKLGHSKRVIWFKSVKLQNRLGIEKKSPAGVR